MRMSVIKNDPGYHPKAYKYQPYLDGVKLEQCVTADDIEGWADVKMSDADGCMVIKNDELVTERLYGKVELKLIKWGGSHEKTNRNCRGGD